MATYSDIFVVTDVAAVYDRIIRCIEAARRGDKVRSNRGLPAANAAIIAKLQFMQKDFQAQLRKIALLTSSRAELAIEDRLRKTQVRSDTGVSPHLRDRIVCRALGPVRGFESGAVGIADEQILNAGATGLYWRSQEFGTGTAEVGSITTAATGRLLRGYFYQTGFRGYPSPPSGEFRAHPVFKPGAPFGKEKIKSPLGVVAREIQGRHFIRDGKLLAAAQWRAQIDALQAEMIRQVDAL